MTDRAQSPGSRSSTTENRQERERARQTGKTVGRDVPDESKERHTEIAVEAGRKGGEHCNDKR
jgi:general stress protein YciG